MGKSAAATARWNRLSMTFVSEVASSTAIGTKDSRHRGGEHAPDGPGPPGVALEQRKHTPAEQ
jgi:hypothetical protein